MILAYLSITSMEFRTNFHFPASSLKITHKSRVFSIGSCFSTMLGEKLQERKFRVLNNPFGTIFNPISIFMLLSKALKEDHLEDRKSTRLNSSHVRISYAVFCLKKKKQHKDTRSSSTNRTLVQTTVYTPTPTVPHQPSTSMPTHSHTTHISSREEQQNNK